MTCTHTDFVAPSPLKKTGDFLWQPICPCIEDRFKSCMKAWLGTPYLKGKRERRGGADCVQFAAGLYDDLFRRDKKSPVRVLHTFISLHNPLKAFGAARDLQNQFALVPVKDNTVQPGDCLILELEPGHPGHLAIVGWDFGTIVHAVAGPGVNMSSIEACGKISKVFRPGGKQQWA